MSLTALIIDGEVSYPRCADGPLSLACLPAGTGSLLDYLIETVRAANCDNVLVLPTYDPDHPCRERIAASDGGRCRLVSQAELIDRLRESETSDYLVVIDPRGWPLGGFELIRTTGELREYRGATHVIAIGADPTSTRELVECGADGQVKRIQRFYNQVNWPEVAGSCIAYSIVPARSAADVVFGSLCELRAGLSAKGAMSRDLPIATELVDLRQESTFLGACERIVSRLSRTETPRGYRRLGEEQFVADGSIIDPSAKLVGPLVVQAGSEVGAHATIVGPAVIGRQCRVEPHATVVQSALSDRSVVPAGATLRHRVVSGHWPKNGEIDRGAPEDATTAGPEVMSGAVTELDEVYQLPVEGGTRRLQMVVKRTIDLTVSALALICLSPFLLVIAILIKLDSRGPVFFSHHREHKDGKDFPCVKFRTMVADAHARQRELYEQNEVDGPQFKMKRDPRVTRVGRWLRATNLDELPQLMNVLLGQMSLVGPRPSPFRENQICVPWRRARLSVRPGITGLWQLCREGESSGDFHEWIYYDILYVRHFSLWLDLKIVLWTVLSLCAQWTVPLSWLIPNAGQNPMPRREFVTA